MNTIQLIADQIRSGQYPREEIDVTQFFHKMSDGEFIPNRDKRVQVRDVDRDIDFVERISNKIKQSGDSSKLEDLTCVYFPDENEVKLLNGNHTAEIEVKSNIFKSPACIVNFDTQLGGKKSNAIRLGNLLNKQDVEKTSVKSNDVRKELYELMEERQSDGLDPKPTDDILDEFVATYPHLFPSKLLVSGFHTMVLLALAVLCGLIPLENLPVNVSILRIWKTIKITRSQNPVHLMVGIVLQFHQAFVECMENNKKKALIIFYCSTMSQSEKLINTDIKTKIKSHYAELGKFWGIQMDTVFLGYE